MSTLALPRLLLAAASLVTFSTGSPAQGFDPGLLSRLAARSIGPSGMSGRVAAICAVEADPRVVYVGAATGGLWRTRDAGLTWEPLFDDQPVASIGALAVFQARPEIVWVGTGEGNPRNSSSVGGGVFRSLDAGRTWQHLGLEGTEKIHRVLLHPSDPDIAYVAALGTTWGASAERGVFKTVDGGSTWERVLFVDERTGCADLELDPTNPDKLFAAMWDHRRRPDFFRSGGPGSGLFVTRDAGHSWTRFDDHDGLPKGDLGRIGLAIAPSRPDTVYALVEAKRSALCRSDDGGATWTQVNTDPGVASRPFYYADLRVDPQDPERVYNLASVVTVSDDGGESFRTLVGWEIHPDHHAMWIDPANPDHIIEGNDGGVAISRDRGATWRFVRNLPLAQYYHVAVDDEVPFNIYGGMQDNGSWRGPSSVWENGGIRSLHWEEVGFGDGFATIPFPDDATQGYAMSQGGSLFRWNALTGERANIRPDAPYLDGDEQAGELVELRFNWNAGIALDPFDPQGVYYGSQFLHHSSDRGSTWEVLSPDLTTNNPEWQRQDESGGLTPDVTAAENYTSILTIAPSRLEAGLLWVGSDDGRLHVTRDGGKSWTSLEERVRGVPRNTWIPHVEASRHDPNRAYVVFDDHRRANGETYLYRTDDQGATFTRVSTDGVSGYAHVLEEDPVDEDLLFLGTEFGLWVSTNGGKRWWKWTHGLPTVSVRALVVHPRDGDLVIGSHGRAAFVIDDIRPLRALSAGVAEAPLTLFEMPRSIQYQVRQTGASRFPGADEFRGENRPYGALISFWLTGDELEHPDVDVERERKRARRAAERAAEQLADALPPADENEDEAAADAEEAHEGADDVAEAAEDAQDSEQKKRAKEKPEQDPDLVLEILDADGESVRRLVPDAHAGLNRVVWDLRRKAIVSERDRDASRSERGGARALPGTYTVRVTFQGATAEGSLVVSEDPRMDVSLEQRRANQAAVERVSALRVTLGDALARIEEVEADLALVLERAATLDERANLGLADDEPRSDLAGELKDASQELSKSLKALRERMRAPRAERGITADDSISSHLGQARWIAGSRRDGPTRAGDKAYERARRELTEAITELNALLGDDLPEFRAAVEGAGVRFFDRDDPIELP